jgi:O-antigen/teichoic acid export membrane protein
LSDVAYGALQQRERMKRVAASMILRGASSLCTLALVIYLTRQVLWGAVALAATWGAMFLAVDASTARSILREERDTPDARRGARASSIGGLALVALPLGVVTMLVSLNGNVPRYYLDHHSGGEGVAFFTAMAYLLVVGNTIVSSLGQAAAPRLARCFAAGNLRGFKRIVLRLGALAGLLGVGGVLVAAVAGAEVLTLLYSGEYASHPRAFVWMMVGGGGMYLGGVLGYAVTAARWFRGQMYIHAACFLVVLVANHLLVQEHGLEGAAMALALTSWLATLAFGVALYIILLRQEAA